MSEIEDQTARTIKWLNQLHTNALAVGNSELAENVADALVLIVQLVSKDDKATIRRWIMEHVTADAVPDDEGNSEGLVFNLITLLETGEGGNHYHYLPFQHAQLRAWYAAAGLPEPGPFWEPET